MGSDRDGSDPPSTAPDQQQARNQDTAHRGAESRLWRWLPQMLIDVIVVFLLYAVASVLLKASEMLCQVLWPTGKTALNAHIIYVFGRSVTPVSFLKFFLPVWLVVSIVLTLVANTYRLISISRRRSTNADRAQSV